jgi:hypothetical protein
MLMFALFLKMFGVCIGFSVLRIFLRQNFVPDHRMTKIGISFFVFHGAHIVFFPNFLLNWMLIYISVITVFGIRFLYFKNQQTQFSKEFPAVLTSIILNMKLGQSFRQALRASIQQAKRRPKMILQAIYEHVAFSQQEMSAESAPKGVWYAEICAEIVKIDGSTHKTIEKVENFRRRLMIVEKFRRRSGRIRGQITLQLILMSLIYAGIFAINYFMFSLKDYKGLVMLSLVFYLAGMITVLSIGRRIRWNI